MKIFELLGRETGHMAKVSGEIKILLAHNDDAMTESVFQELCRAIVNELRLKENADNVNIPLSDRKTRAEIVTKISTQLCERSHFNILPVNGRFQLQGFPA